MRVLEINKFLYGGAGAETVMFRTAQLLRDNGHEVSFFAMQDQRNVSCAESKYFPSGRYYGAEHGMVQRTRAAASSIYSLQARKALRRLIQDLRPEVAHLHNVYHQLTLSVVDELVAQKVPIVMTLHDYKPVCPSYVLYTNDELCHRCVTSHPGHAIVHRCIKGSRAASIVGTVEALVVRGRKLYQKVDAFISPSQHLANIMIEGGLSADRMHVIPNFVADEQFARPGSRTLSDPPSVLYVGRLEEVKGIQVLLAAARTISPEIEIIFVGHGPLEDEVRRAQEDGIVRYLGHQDWDGIARLMDRAHALVVPSLWEENCPMVVLEAGARGCPVIASDRGGLSELVCDNTDGVLTKPGDHNDLTTAIRRMTDDNELCERLGRARWQRTLARNAPAAYLDPLISLYQSLLPKDGSGILRPGFDSC